MQMYRHFAVVTVVLTAMLALVAEDRRDQVDSDSYVIGEAQAATVEQVPSQEFAEQPEMEDYETSGSWGEDSYDPAFGSPMDGSSASSYIPGGSALASLAERGYSSDYLGQLEEEERRKLLTGLTGEGEDAPSKSDIRRAENASRVRTGAAGRE